jgi:hypothetical protein
MGTPVVVTLGIAAVALYTVHLFIQMRTESSSLSTTP